MEQQLILEQPDSWHWKEKVKTLKSESDHCEKWKWLVQKNVKVVTVKKWKWWHNWQICAHLIPDNEKRKWYLWKVKVISVKSESDYCEREKSESDGKNGTAIFDSWHSNESGSHIGQLWVTKVLSFWFTDFCYDQIFNIFQVSTNQGQSGSVVIFHETPRVKKGPYFHAPNVWVFVKVVHKCICCSFPLHREEPIFLMSEGNDIQKKRSYVKFGIWLICQIWHTDGYGSTPSAWVYSQFLPSGKLKIIILTKSFIILLFYSKSWKSWMAMYWALWWCYSSFEAKKTLSSSVTLWCNGLWRHTKGPSLLRTLEKFYPIDIEIKDWNWHTNQTQ